MKPVVLSSLSMRFYSRDGWTREELEDLFIVGKSGKLIVKDEGDPLEHYIFDIHSKIETEKLISMISEVLPTWTGQPTNIREAVEQYTI